MDYSEFVEKCDEIIVALEPLIDADLRHRLLGIQERLLNDRLNILVIGEFSRGKSSLINGMLGEVVLPSKINPTTATINVLKGGPRSANIIFRDGQEQKLNLPDTKVSRYLTQYVTLKNEDADHIQEVHITLPGPLEGLRANIVDTPGVNDLDEAREQTTFGYLRKADAAILLLDAHQPLSESECFFIKDKVFGSDVNRIIFAVNKIDDLEQESAVDRIIKYVRKRLAEHLKITDAHVFGISARSALRVRVKGLTDENYARFEAFEKFVYDFAGRQALETRMIEQLGRMKQLVFDQKNIINEESTLLSSDVTGVQNDIQTSIALIEVIKQQAKQLTNQLDIDKQTIRNTVIAHTEVKISEMNALLESHIQNASFETDINDLKRSLAEELNKLTESIQQFATDIAQKKSHALKASFQDLLGEESTSLSIRPQNASVPSQFRRDLSGKSFENIQNPEDFDMTDAAVGFGLGWVGISLFGPLGIAAAVFGTYALGKSRREEKMKMLMRQERMHMISNLRSSCAQLADRAKIIGTEIADTVAEALKKQILEQSTLNVKLLQTKQRAIHDRQMASEFELKQRFSNLNKRLSKLHVVEKKLKTLQQH